jgi:8-oxo-dGTP diphosphatase
METATQGTYDRPKVGIGVFVKKDGKYLLGLRKGSHGAGKWSLPGGHQEGGESFEEACTRKVGEETGLLIKNICPLCFTNDLFEEEKLHYVTLFFTADWESGDVINREPNKCEKWEWRTDDNFPSPLFAPLENLISMVKGIDQ